MTVIQGPQGGHWVVTEYDESLMVTLESLGMTVQTPDDEDQRPGAPKMLVKLKNSRCT